MYYHLLIETSEKIGKSKTNRIVTDIDRTDLNLIIEEVIIPYQKGQEFVVNGFVLVKKNIIRLKVISTDKSARELSEYENAHMPAGVIMYISPEDILSYDKYITDITTQVLKESSEYGKKDEKQVSEKTFDKNKIFIVHGRDNESKITVARFVEKLGFEASILHEQASDGMTIIEKIEKNTNVGFAIVLYTPCDIGYPKDEPANAKNRARQNVVFEHGYLISKIGRNNVCALVRGDIETPNDISGVVYIKMDENEGWKLPLAKEMKSSGLDVDYNLVI